MFRSFQYTHDQQLSKVQAPANIWHYVFAVYTSTYRYVYVATAIKQVSKLFLDA